MITGSFSNEEIMQTIENEIEDEKITKVQFSAVVFKNITKMAYTVGLFINGMYILEEDIFEANTIEELELKMKEISDLIYNEYGVREATYNIDFEGRHEDNIYDKKVC
jgi:hypothetical protein